MATVSTPVNTINRDNLIVLIRNNVMNTSIEFASDTDVMETDSPVRKPRSLQPIIKKLFHSPIPDSQLSPKGAPYYNSTDRVRKSRKRKHSLLPNSSEKIKMAYVKECDKDSYSPEPRGGMRKRVLISLFHNKEYSMDCD